MSHCRRFSLRGLALVALFVVFAGCSGSSKPVIKRDWTEADTAKLVPGIAWVEVENVLGTGSPVSDTELARHVENTAEVRSWKSVDIFQWTSGNTVVVAGSEGGKLRFVSIKPLTGE